MPELVATSTPPTPPRVVNTIMMVLVGFGQLFKRLFGLLFGQLFGGCLEAASHVRGGGGLNFWKRA